MRFLSENHCDKCIGRTIHCNSSDRMWFWWINIAIILLYISGCVVADGKTDTATITKWQFCFGCKETVFLYLQKMYDALNAMEKTGKPPSSVLDANKISELICDDEYFKNFQPFVKFSCIKLLSDGKEKFLDNFAGATSVQTALNKAENFKRKENICVKQFEACNAEEFSRANITKAQRTKCNACRIVGNEIEMYKKSMAKGKSLHNFLDDGFCANLGYSYQPYNWIESVCDEMIEDKLDDILDILRFNAKVAATGLVPSETATEMMCKEFYNCKQGAHNSDL